MNVKLVVKALQYLKNKPVLKKGLSAAVILLMLIPFLLFMVLNNLIGDLASMMGLQKMGEEKYKSEIEIEIPRELIHNYYIPASIEFGIPWSILAGLHAAQTEFAMSGGFLYNDAFDLPDEIWVANKISKRDILWHRVPHSKKEEEDHDHFPPNRGDLDDIIWTVARYFQGTTKWNDRNEVNRKIKDITKFNDKTDQAIALAWAYNLQYGASSTMLSLEPSDLALSIIPPGYIEIYKEAEEEFQVPWNYLAAIHYVESRFGTYVNPITKKLMVSETGETGHYQCKPGQGSCGSFDVKVATMGMGKFIYDHGFPPGEGDEEPPEKPVVPYALSFFKQTPNYVSIIQAQAAVFAVEGPVSMGDYVVPVTNFTFSSPFGPRWGRMHKGIDMAAPLGTTIYAYAAGKVIYAGRSGTATSGYGTLISIDHGNGMVTRYGHSRRLYVSAGQEVPAGYPIAAVGSEGGSTGPHLHFEVMINGKHVDPLPYIKQ